MLGHEGTGVNDMVPSCIPEPHVLMSEMEKFSEKALTEL